MKTYIAKAVKTSPVPQHVHATMFIQSEVYQVRKIENDKEFVRVEGRFKNSLGGFEFKSQSIKKTICQEYLTIN